MKGIFISNDDETDKLAQKLKFCCDFDTYKVDEADVLNLCNVITGNYDHILIDEKLYKSSFYEMSLRLGWFNMRSGTITFLKGFSTYRLYHVCRGDCERMFPIELYTKRLDEDKIVDLFRRTLVGDVRGGAPVKINSFFNKIGLSRTLKGHDYLVEAIRLVNSSPELMSSLTKGLYPMIGHKFGVSGSVVERCIRNAIDSVVSKGKFFDVANCLYGGNFGKYEKPTNGEFISFISLI